MISPPSLNRGDSGTSKEGDESIAGDSVEGEPDVVMRETTGAVNALKMDTKAGWEEVHVEDVEVDRKPILTKA